MKANSDQESQPTDPELDTFNFTEDELMELEKLNSTQTFEKGTILLREGEVSRNSYYVIKGCVRQYFLKDGEEKTSFFFTENESISSTSSIDKNEKSTFYLECLEETELKIVSKEKEQKLYSQFPRFERLCRRATEIDLKESKKMFSLFMSSSPTERYVYLLTNRPGLINRVPQYQLASYLGVTPESLSRIRKRLAKK